MSKLFKFSTGMLIIIASSWVGCATPPLKEYAPLPAATPAAAPTLKAAVSLADNRSRTPSESEMDDQLADWLKSLGTFITPKVNAVVPCMVPPEKFTEIIIKDLKATGSFVSVEDEGAGAADLLVRPTIKNCVMVIVGYNVHNLLDLSLQVQVLQRGKQVMDKTYTKRWTDIDWGNPNLVYQELLPPIMKQLREDVIANAR